MHGPGSEIFAPCGPYTNTFGVLFEPPGVQVASVLADNAYVKLWGTSFGAPLVAGFDSQPVVHQDYDRSDSVARFML